VEILSTVMLSQTSRAMQTKCLVTTPSNVVRKVTLVAIPGQSTLTPMVQQPATAAEETPSGHWACSTFRL
jgi:hypothetical protein